MKRQICWITALTLFWVTVTFGSEIFGWQLMSGFSGLAIKFFFCYCALILVAQVFSALRALRTLLVEVKGGTAPSRQALLGAEEPSISSEE